MNKILQKPFELNLSLPFPEVLIFVKIPGTKAYLTTDTKDRFKDMYVKYAMSAMAWTIL